MVTWIWVNIDSGNALLPDGTKPLPEPMLDSSIRSSDIHPRAISQKIPQSSIIKISLKITYLKLHSNLPRADELSLYQDKLMPTLTNSLDADFLEINVGERQKYWEIHVLFLEDRQIFSETQLVQQGRQIRRAIR